MATTQVRLRSLRCKRWGRRKFCMWKRDCSVTYEIMFNIVQIAISHNKTGWQHSVLGVLQLYRNERRTSSGGRMADTPSLYYLATTATGTWIAQSHGVLTGYHTYWQVTSTGSLYYLATMATGTWIAQSHSVLTGYHTYWKVTSTGSLYYLATMATGTRIAQSHSVLTGYHTYWQVTSTGSLYYLATMATGTWKAQSHSVLTGDHTCW